MDISDGNINTFNVNTWFMYYWSFDFLGMG